MVILSSSCYISPDLRTITSFEKFNRFVEVPRKGMQCDLLWADPSPDYDQRDEEDFRFNKPRGCSYFVSYRAICRFLERNKLLAVIRGHQVVNEGVQFYRERAKFKFPSLITLFSAPNYCDVYNNKGAVGLWNRNRFQIFKYKAQAHPFVLPNFLNAFTWSLPFIVNQVTGILQAVMNIAPSDSRTETMSADTFYSAQENIDHETSVSLTEKEKQTIEITKIMKDAETQSNRALKLGAITPTDYSVLSGSKKLDKDVGSGEDGVELTFEMAQKLDRDNEKWVLTNDALT
ncbi:hypothetical protein ACOME3_006844 [Neoechinorhynchus agilis]